MRYRLIADKRCPQALCDRLNDALDTSQARRLYHAAKSTYRFNRDHSETAFRAFLKKSTCLPVENLDDILERSGLGFHEAMLLPVYFDMTGRAIT